jgi:catecholate siderophore receptor
MSSKPSSSAARRTFLALSCIVPAFAPVAHAQQSDTAERSLGGMTVTDSAIVEEPGRKLESPKRTRTVRDTPQTITVLTNEVIELTRRALNRAGRHLRRGRRRHRSRRQHHLSRL